MKSKGLRLIILFLLACTTAWGCKTEPPPKDQAKTSRSAFKPKPRNVSLILDTSGSMNQTDATRMTLYSAMLFTDLLETTDALSVSCFPGKGRFDTQQDLEAGIASWAQGTSDLIVNTPRAQMKDWIRNVQYDSNFTIFYEPLERAVSLMQGNPGRFSQRVIVFFSDGATDRHNMPPSNPQCQQALRDDHARETERIGQNLLPGFIRDRITFYGVVLGQDTAANHFELLAGKTGGLVRKTASPEDLAINFTEIFGKILQTEVENKTFNKDKPETLNINRYVKELILVVPTGTLAEARQIQLHLVEPAKSGKLSLHTGSPQQSDQGLYNRMSTVTDGLTVTVDGQRVEAGGYAIWKIAKPAAGDWSVSLEGCAGSSLHALVIQNYGIYMEVEGSKNRFGMVDEPNAFKARLVTEEGEPITDPEFYKKHGFRFEFRVDGKTLARLTPDSAFMMNYDYVPKQAAAGSKIEIVAKNDVFLDTKLLIDFTAYKGVTLKLNGDLEFGKRVPWTDWFLEGIGSILGPSVWRPGDKWNKQMVEANFEGSARNAEGVRFRVDNTELYKKYKARILSADGSETFYLDSEMRALFCMDVDRDSAGGDLAAVRVPIKTVSGKDIFGVDALPLRGGIEPLSPWSWKYSHLWLEEILIVWLLLFFLGKPYNYIFRNSFPRSKRYFFSTKNMFDAEKKKGSPKKAARRSMGQPLILRLFLSYFQFLWGTQVAAGGTRLRTNPVTRVAWFLLAAVLPLSMADRKTIGGFKFYRYKGQMMMTEDQFQILERSEKGRGAGRAGRAEERPDPRRLRSKNVVDQALVMDRKMVLHIP